MAKNKYKYELIDSFPDGEPLTGYRQGEFFDLCRGPHLHNLGKIKAFKVMKTSGAYWRGDAKNEMLTRVYAISYPDRKLLKEYLHMLEEAKKRDHKILGPKLDLFSLKEEAPGMPFIHPKGMIVWNQLIDFIRERLDKNGYVEIKTPSLMMQRTLGTLRPLEQLPSKYVHLANRRARFRHQADELPRRHALLPKHISTATANCPCASLKSAMSTAMSLQEPSQASSASAASTKTMPISS